MAERADPVPHGDAHGDAHGDTHRHESPEDWGWHASFGKWARIAGWIAVAALLINNVTTYYNDAHAPWLFGGAGILVFILLRDHYRRKNAWRND